MATARVRLIIEVATGSSWTADTTMAQIYKQASTETLAKVRTIIGNNRHLDAKIIGEPEVIAVYHAMERAPR